MATAGHIAARRQVAIERLSAAADALAERHELAQGGDFSPPVPIRDPELRGVYRLEALADLLDALEAVPPATGGATDDLTIADLAQRLSTIGDPATLEAMRADEEAGKGRKGALTAIDERLAALEIEQGDEEE